MVAWISKGLDERAIPLPPDEPVQMTQRGCVYTPHVVGLQVGQLLRISNEDNAAHNVHAKPKKAKLVGGGSFNRPHPAGSGDLEWVFDREEISVFFGCDLHPWMKSYVAVVEHPYFAVSGPDGSFVIEDVPPGEYTVSTWHEKWTRAKRTTVVVPPQGVGEVSFTYED